MSDEMNIAPETIPNEAVNTVEETAKAPSNELVSEATPTATVETVSTEAVANENITETVEPTAEVSSAVEAQAPTAYVPTTPVEAPIGEMPSEAAGMPVAPGAMPTTPEVMPTVPGGAPYMPVGAPNVEAPEAKKKSALPIVLTVVSLLVIAASAIILILNRKVENLNVEKDWYADQVAIQTVDTEVEYFEGINLSDSALSDTWVYGRSLYTDVITSDANYWYLSNPKDSNKLYRVSKADYTNEKLLDYPVSSINVIDDTVYYVVNDASQGVDLGIYSYDLNTKETEYITDDPSSRMYVANEWIYYLSTFDGNLYRMNITNRQKIQLTDEDNLYTYTFRDNDIIYIAEDEDDDWTIYKTNVDASEKEVLCAVDSLYYASFYEDNIYVVDSNENIYSIDYGTGEKNKVTKKPIDSHVSKKDNKLFFVTLSKKGKLTIYDMETEDTNYYGLEYVTNVYFADDLIMIYYLDGQDQKVTVNDFETGKAVNFFN